MIGTASTSLDLPFSVHIQPESISGLMQEVLLFSPVNLRTLKNVYIFQKSFSLFLVISCAGPLHDSRQASRLFGSWQCHYEAPQLTTQAQLISGCHV